MGQSDRKSYSEQLLDPRWQRKRLEVLNAADFCCEDCGSDQKTLHVHHRQYRKGALAWEYSADELVSLCDQCHETRHKIQSRLNFVLSNINNSGLSELLGYAEAALVGYEATSIKVFDGESISGIANYYKTNYQVVCKLTKDDGTVLVDDILEAIGL